MLFICILIGILSVIALICSIVYYRKHVVERSSILSDYKKENFEKHYVMIVGDSDAAFWKHVYESAKKTAKEQGAYLEFLGTNLDVKYDKKELVNIAIQSQVDGIVLEAGNDKEMAAFIDKAANHQIPVITVNVILFYNVNDLVTKLEKGICEQRQSQ